MAITIQTTFFKCFFCESEPCVSTHFKDSGAFLSSRLNSHLNFEPDGMVHVDFPQFPTHVVAALQFSPEIDRKLTGNQSKFTGNRPEINRKSRWGTPFGVLRVPDETATQGPPPSNKKNKKKWQQLALDPAPAPLSHQKANQKIKKCTPGVN